MATVVAQVGRINMEIPINNSRFRRPWLNWLRQCPPRSSERARGGTRSRPSALVNAVLVFACLLLVVARPSQARADPAWRLAGGFTFAAALPDSEHARAQIGAPWFIRGEMRGLSLLDRTPVDGDRPTRGHFAVYDAFFLEAGVGALCSKSDCVSLGDVHLRGVAGYEALVGWRAPSASVYVGPRVAWEGWITNKLALGSVSWPVVVRFDHAVARTRRRILSAWASPHGAFRSYGAEWDEPLSEGLWVATWAGGTRALTDLSRDDSSGAGALALTVSLGIRGGSPF